MVKTMRRIAQVLTLCTLLLPMAAWANGVLLTNEFGSVTLSDAGIVATGSELTGFRSNWNHAPPGHDLGSVSFSTGALVSGSVLGGGVFSSTGSSFISTGFGNYGVPNGTIFSGSFLGPIDWTLVSKTSSHYVFDLTGNLSGVLFSGRSALGTTTQTIYVSMNQQGSIHVGHTAAGVFGGLTPEPGTLLLFGTGLTVIVGAMRSKLFGT